MSKYEAIILCGKVQEYQNIQKIPKCLIKIHGKPFYTINLNI